MDYNIVVASDENYAAHMATLIVSICENNTGHKIVIHIFDGGLSDKTKQQLKILEARYHYIRLVYYTVLEKDIMQWLGGNVTKDRSLSAFGRVFIPRLLDDKIERAVYFDVDAICCSAIEELFEMNLDEYYIAGVQDCNFNRSKLAVGLNKNSNYINSGMIVWNLNACRKENVVDLLVNFVRTRNGNVVAMDQGTINGTLSDKIKIIHPRWNVLTPFFQMNSNQLKIFYGMNKYYSDKELSEARQNPGFVHFVPNFTTRPWMEHCTHPLREEYCKYRNMTPFNDYTPMPDNRDKKSILLSTLFRVLPKPVFLFLYQNINRRKELRNEEHD